MQNLKLLDPGTGIPAQELCQGGGLQTNNQASQGGSILKANVELEVAEALAGHVDAKGVPSVAKHWAQCFF